MKLLRKAVLIGWALALAAGAVTGAGDATTAAMGKGAGGGAKHDTGWG
ncbi:hypothetical protein [Streptomyces sp. NPDC055287]